MVYQATSNGSTVATLTDSVNKLQVAYYINYLLQKQHFKQRTHAVTNWKYKTTYIGLGNETAGY